MQYFNLALTIKSSAGGGFEVTAQSETMGETAGRLVLPLGPAELAAARDTVAAGTADPAFLATFGRQLCDALFTGDVGILYRECLGEVHRDDERGVRLRLCLESPELSAIPWELAYDASRDVFLATSSETPLTRYISVHEPIDELRTAPPVSVLVAIPDGSGLDVATERATIEDALSELGDAVSVTVLDGRVTRSSISAALLQKKHHIFHFIGHGEFDGTDGHLILNDDQGFQREDPISAKSFAGFFRDYPSMKLVVLNACQGAAVSSTRPLAGIAPQVVRARIPAVVAMQFPFADQAALVFAREFYLKLCSGSDRGRVDTALAHARNRLLMDFEKAAAFAAPVLYMRSPTGVIFDLERPQPRSLLMPRGDIDRLEAVKQTHQANIAARQDLGEEHAAAIEEDRRGIASIDRTLRRYFLMLGGLVVGSWLVLFASWIGLFNAVRLDDWLETRFVTYMDPYIATPFDDRVTLVLAAEDPARNGRLGATGSPDWRCHHATLLDGLSAVGAAVVAFDLYFDDAADCDGRFADAIRRAAEKGTRVVLGVRQHTVQEGVPHPRIAPALAAAVQDGWGILDGDPTSRRIRLAAPVTERAPLQIDERESAVVPSFALRTLMLLESRSRGGRPITAALDRSQDVLRLRDSDRTLVRTVPVTSAGMDLIVDLASGDDLAPASYHEVLDNAPHADRLARFNGAVVVVGYGTPQDRLREVGRSGEPRYGVELQASAVSNLLRGVHPRPLSTLAEYGWIVVMGGLGALFAWRGPRRTFKGIPLALVAAVALYALVVFLMYKQYRLIFDIGYHVVSLLFMYAMTLWVRRAGSLRPAAKQA